MRRRSGVRGPRSAPVRARDSRAAAKPPPSLPVEIQNRLWPWLGALAIAALLWSCRGYRLGVPVADDYSFLARLEFQKPLDPFDSMGASYYWRPLSRQLYFSIIGHSLFTAPWMAALLNTMALLATYLAMWRIARRAYSPAIATAIAMLPLVSEPARTLLAWPSGAQHLFAGAFAMLAIDQALSSRWIAAAALAGAGMLCHESAVLSLAAIPVVAWLKQRSARSRRIELVPPATDPASLARGATPRDLVIAIAAAVTVLGWWWAGYAVARAHGVELPHQAGAQPITRFPRLMSLAVPAAFNLEDVPASELGPLTVGYLVIATLALLSLIRPAARRQLSLAAAALAGGTLWFLLGTAPLTRILPDWNSWRAWLPVLGLDFGVAAALALLYAPLALAFAGLKLIALLVAPAAAPFVTTAAPVTASQMAYVRLARLQRTTESSRLAILRIYPTLPHGGAVRYTNMPRLAEVAFQGSSALRVWYRDSTLSWDKFGGLKNLDKHFDAMLEYRDNAADPATAIEREAFQKDMTGSLLMANGRLAAADTLFQQAMAATRTRGPTYGTMALNRGWIAVSRMDLAAAESFRLDAQRYGTRDADYWSLVGRLAFLNNDLDQATQAIQHCLALDPKNPSGLETANALDQAVVQGRHVGAPTSSLPPAH